eukprot:653476-Prorocentrum_lima.AAC.1
MKRPSGAVMQPPPPPSGFGGLPQPGQAASSGGPDPNASASAAAQDPEGGLPSRQDTKAPKGRGSLDPKHPASVEMRNLRNLIKTTQDPEFKAVLQRRLEEAIEKLKE